MRPLKALPPLPLAHVPQGLELVGRRYAALPMTPLRIRATLGTPYTPSEPGGALHLDGVLGWAVIQSLPYPVRWPAGTAAVVPLPLALLWISPEGLPLWASSLIRPVGETADSRYYWHKRYPGHRAELGDRVSAQTRAGRWKEYRIPVGAVAAREVVGAAIGHAPTVRDLLAHVTHLGKHAATGDGRVLAWDVAETSWPLEWTRTAIACDRPVPLRYYTAPAGAVPGDVPALLGRRGFTPPYWYVPWHEPCLAPDPAQPEDWSRTEWDAPPAADVDWFEAAR